MDKETQAIRDKLWVEVYTSAEKRHSTTPAYCVARADDAVKAFDNREKPKSENE